VTQVDFYILPNDSAEERLRLACRVTEKALQQGQQVLINTESPAESARLDDLLWTFSQGSFIPHRLIDKATSAKIVEPVVIGCGIAPESQDTQVLINLAGTVPEFFSRYQRVAELVDGNDHRRMQGRERFRFYREKGCELHTHQL
jgi:DNA polymerase-3 subunit chi